jgi:hypothetical protein
MSHWGYQQYNVNTDLNLCPCISVYLDLSTLINMYWKLNPVLRSQYFLGPDTGVFTIVYRVVFIVGLSSKGLLYTHYIIQCVHSCLNNIYYPPPPYRTVLLESLTRGLEFPRFKIQEPLIRSVTLPFTHMVRVFCPAYKVKILSL